MFPAKSVGWQGAPRQPVISQLYALVIDRSKYIKFPEAIEVLEKHLKAGYSDYVPKWR